nr:hypothetical protein Iba_chr01aCG5790 [Ipomoea batatas]
MVEGRGSIVSDVTFSPNLLHSDGSRHRVAATMLVVRRPLRFLLANDGSDLPVERSTTESPRSEFSPARHGVGGGAGLPAMFSRLLNCPLPAPKIPVHALYPFSVVVTLQEELASSISMSLRFTELSSTSMAVALKYLGTKSSEIETN